MKNYLFYMGRGAPGTTGDLIKPKKSSKKEPKKGQKRPKIALGSYDALESHEAREAWDPTNEHPWHPPMGSHG